MSLILEALKKSEQQRRLGEAPTLGSPVLSTRRHRSLLPLFGALVLIALGVGWWLARPASTSPAPVAEIAHGSAAPTAAPPPAATTVAAPGHGKSASNRPVTARPAAAKPAGSAAANGARERAATPAPTHGVDRPGALVPLPPALPAVAGPQAAPAHATPEKPAAPAAAPADRIGAPAPANPPTPPATTTPSHGNTQAQPRQAALPTVWDLPYATRKDLPDLTLTMHVYAPDPQQRFVVIKGERHVEGDDLGDGVTLHEIRADGMVLDFKGKRFVYPRDGR